MAFYLIAFAAAGKGRSDHVKAGKRLRRMVELSF
jgi:hypothetical protein